jgi:23S rRNA (cytidine2498-2'-O)-methyltransferase
VNALILYCRPGLENDTAAEIMARAAEHDVPGYVKANPGTGWLQFAGSGDVSVADLLSRQAFAGLIFPRQWFLLLAHLRELPPDDRVSPLAAAFGTHRPGDVWVEYPDTNEGKELSKLARGVEGHLQRRLHTAAGRKSRPAHDDNADRDGAAPAHRRQHKTGLRGHVLLLSGAEALVGVSPCENSAPWPLGYPRLRFPREAPSRSTLKLEEAWHVLLGEDTDNWPRPGQRAVDLGAAPGGWTWQLIQRGCKVTAVDNGPMDAKVMDEGRVTHLREDAFAFKPASPVDWMVCDVVDQPAKVASLVERWLVRGWCRQTIFNLKLPMKKRFQEVEGILGRLAATLDEAGIVFHMRARQLYHDREEITVWVQRGPL